MQGTDIAPVVTSCQFVALSPLRSKSHFQERVVCHQHVSPLRANTPKLTIILLRLRVVSPRHDLLQESNSLLGQPRLLEIDLSNKGLGMLDSTAERHHQHTLSPAMPLKASRN